MIDPDRNILGEIFSQVEVKGKKSSHILCTLDDFNFDKNTKFVDILTRVHIDYKFLSKSDVLATMHPTSQLKDVEASPVRSLECFFHLYHFSNLHYIKFTTTVLSELPEPLDKMRCLNDVLTKIFNSQFKNYNINSTTLNNLSIPNRFDENKELNTKHKTYNKIIYYCADKKLGWMGNDHEISFK